MKSKIQNDLFVPSFSYSPTTDSSEYYMFGVPSISLGGTWDEASEYSCPHCHTRIDYPKELDFCFGCLSWVRKDEMDYFHYRVTLKNPKNNKAKREWENT